MTIDNFLTGIIASMISIFADGLMILVIMGCYRIPSMKSSFGILVLNQNLAEFIPCTACIIVFFFGLTLDIKTVIEYSNLIGGTTMIMLYIILFSFFLISFNRFCAIAFPIAYSFMFKEKYLIGILAIGWLIPFGFGINLMVFQGCTYRFNLSGWYFSELKNENCGAQLITFISAQIIPTSAIVIVDVATLVMLVTLNKKIFNSKSAEAKRLEINFASQVLVQGLLFLFRGFWYRGGRNLMPEMAENWKIYWTTSFSTSVFNVFDPMIIFICNMEFRKWVFGMLKKKRKVTVVSSTSLNS